MTRSQTVALVGAARPNFVKLGPLHAALAARPSLAPVVVHCGQHQGAEMSDPFFAQLGLPKPVASFGVGQGTHARQTAEVMIAFEAWLARERPALVVVVGDVNSTLACALVASKAGVPLAHVEAGLRSFDRTMPEELNRIVVDALSDLLFASEPSAVSNLRREGIPDERVHFVGNVVIDALLAHRDAAASSGVRKRLGLEGGHALATLHRPGNVDDPARLAGLLGALGEVAQELRVVLPLHPRTRAAANAAGLTRLLEREGLVVTPPLPYLDFLHLMATARVVLTDSGGIQEETTVLGVPCLTLRDNTERPITVDEGTNRVVGTRPDAILEAFREVMTGPPRLARVPDRWDGRAAERIADVVCAQLAGGA